MHRKMIFHIILDFICYLSYININFFHREMRSIIFTFSWSQHFFVKVEIISITILHLLCFNCSIIYIRLCIRKRQYSNSPLGPTSFNTGILFEDTVISIVSNYIFLRPKTYLLINSGKLCLSSNFWRATTKRSSKLTVLLSTKAV